MSFLDSMQLNSSVSSVVEHESDVPFGRVRKEAVIAGKIDIIQRGWEAEGEGWKREGKERSQKETNGMEP